MPRVPYTPYPTAAPSEQGAPGISLQAPPAFFGENVGRALEHLGTVSEQAGNELFSRAVALQQLRNETEAKEADAQYMIEAGKLHADFSTKQGKAAVDAYPEYTQNLQKLRQDFRNGLSNDMARRMYDSSSLSTMGRTIFNGAGHAATQNKMWVKGVADANIDMDGNAVVESPKDDGLFQDKLQRTQDNVSIKAGVMGLDPVQEKDLLRNTTSKLWSQRIIGLSRTDPFQAAKFLDQHKSELTETDFLRVDNAVRAQGRAVGSVNIANGIFEAGIGDDNKPQKSLEAMESEARELAKKQDPDDPLLEQHAIAALRGRWNQYNYSRKQEGYENAQIVNEAIISGVKDEQELRANPKVAAALDALPADKRKGIPAAINAYNSARSKVANEENFTKIMGLANNDVEAFLNLDPNVQNLSQPQIRQVAAKQAQLKSKVTEDPRVNRAIGWMRNSHGSELEALGIYRRTVDNKDDYDHYTGAMQAAIDVWQEAHGKPPSIKDITEDIGPQIIKARMEPGFLQRITGGRVGSPNQVPFFKQEVPEKFATEITADVIARGGIEPTPEQIYRAYLRTQAIKLYGKSSGPNP